MNADHSQSQFLYCATVLCECQTGGCKGACHCEDGAVRTLCQMRINASRTAPCRQDDGEPDAGDTDNGNCKMSIEEKFYGGEFLYHYF